MPQCKQCTEQFPITPADQAFYAKLAVPEPTLCPLCRRQRILAWRNQRILYSRPCDATKKNIISVFAPNAPYRVYDRDYWWSDKWDPTSYGRDFDFTKTFAENYDALLHDVPMAGIFNARSVNSAYSNHSGEMKDCYLAFAVWGSEKVLYGDLSSYDRDCAEMLETGKCNLSYEMIQTTNCYNTNYSVRSENCSDSWFLFDCKDCSDCIGCTNLRSKQYYIFNKQYSREEYEKRKKELALDTRTGITNVRAQFETLKKQCVHRFASLTKCENSTGDYLVGAGNTHDSFALRGETQNCAFCINGIDKLTDTYDSYGVGASLERAYMVLDTGVNATENIACVIAWSCQFAYYSYNCHSSFEIFGCSGLRNKKFCILNKQYEEAEYKELKARIIEHMKRGGEWGEFFPPQIAPFGVNETIAQEERPVNKEEALRLGFKWQDYSVATRGKETLGPEAVPETIAATGDDIVQQILACAGCGKNYKIVKAELVFYKTKGLPILLQCPDCRYQARLAVRNPHQLWHRQCMCVLASHETHSAGAQCLNEFETSYAPDRPEKIFCENCYQKEVI